jgi:hypothetical protein
VEIGVSLSIPELFTGLQCKSKRVGVDMAGGCGSEGAALGLLPEGESRRYESVTGVGEAE